LPPEGKRGKGENLIPLLPQANRFTPCARPVLHRESSLADPRRGWSRLWCANSAGRTEHMPRDAGCGRAWRDRGHTPSSFPQLQRAGGSEQRAGAFVAAHDDLSGGPQPPQRQPVRMPNVDDERGTMATNSIHRYIRVCALATYLRAFPSMLRLRCAYIQLDIVLDGTVL